MFKPWEQKVEDEKINDREEHLSECDGEKKTNTILKGNRLIGDISVTCDLELSGDIEGNITSAQRSNIVIKGTCKGNIETKEGNVDIQGELQGGNIIAGNDVNIMGKFSGGQIRANGKIFVNGEFNGKLQGKEIEIGSSAVGKGDIQYEESISVARGARVEGQINQIQELKLVMNAPETEALDIELPSKEMTGTK